VVCRELTKTHEEVIRGAVGDLAEWAAEGVLGEVTIVVAGAPRPPRADPADAAEEVAVRERAGTPRKVAIAEVAKELGLPKREVYDAVVRRAPDTR
jgi:16S rRNA (cytidine1402-2'-O)-methyltransferase